MKGVSLTFQRCHSDVSTPPWNNHPQNSTQQSTNMIFMEHLVHFRPWVNCFSTPVISSICSDRDTTTVATLYVKEVCGIERMGDFFFCVVFESGWFQAKEIFIKSCSDLRVWQYLDESPVSSLIVLFFCLSNYLSMWNFYWMSKILNLNAKQTMLKT